MQSGPVSRQRQYLFAILCGLLFPLTGLIHEGGHFLVGYWQGCAPTMSYKNVSYSKAAVAGSSDLVRLAAGPAVDLVLTAMGIAGLAWRRKFPLPGSISGAWAWTMLTEVGFRWFRTFPRGSDETRISTMLGWHHLVLPLVMLPIAVVSVIMLVRFHRQNHSMRPLVLNWVVIGLAQVVWMFVVGPAVLPTRP